MSESSILSDLSDLIASTERDLAEARHSDDMSGRGGPGGDTINFSVRLQLLRELHARWTTTPASACELPHAVC